jgi:hypothetical protein
MSRWNELATWLYGDPLADRGFWYSHPLYAVHDLTEEQLFWTPDDHCMCMLWHAGHIAHRERYHIAHLLQGQTGEIIPKRYDVFGTDWQSPAEVRASIDSVAGVFQWMSEVRQQSADYICALKDDDWQRVLPAVDNLTVAHWLFITVSHGALHIGKIQMLRAMLEGRPDEPC